MLLFGQGRICEKCFKFSKDFSEFRARQANLLETQNMRTQAGVQHIGWHLSFELTISGKQHDGPERLFGNPKILFQAFEVPVVLMDGILKLVFATVNRLAPRSVLGRTENPSFERLRLDDKDPKLRNDNVIDLSCAAGGRNYQIVKRTVELLIKTRPQADLHSRFSEPSFQEMEHQSAQLSTWCWDAWNFQ